MLKCVLSAYDDKLTSVSVTPVNIVVMCSCSYCVCSPSYCCCSSVKRHNLSVFCINGCLFYFSEIEKMNRRFDVEYCRKWVGHVQDTQEEVPFFLFFMFISVHDNRRYLNHTSYNCCVAIWSELLFDWTDLTNGALFFLSNKELHYVFQSAMRDRLTPAVFCVNLLDFLRMIVWLQPYELSSHTV